MYLKKKDLLQGLRSCASAGRRLWWVKQKCTNKTWWSAGFKLLNVELSFQVCEPGFWGMFDKRWNVDGDSHLLCHQLWCCCTENLL